MTNNKYSIFKKDSNIKLVKARMEWFIN